MVWIRGGAALATGSSKETLYDGVRLAREGVVGVSINYRLGVLGWLSYPDLSAESPAWPEVAALLTRAGIDSISVNPGSFPRTVEAVARAETAMTVA